MGIEEFRSQMQRDGYFIFPDAIRPYLVGMMIDDLEKAYKHCRRVQVENGIENSEFTCHHLLGLGSSFMECLSRYEHLDEYLTDYFGGKYILNSFGGNLLHKEVSYANNIHRDIRSFSAHLPLMLNSLVMLDNFTPENGATWLMRGGHHLSDKPTQEEFDAHKFQITGKAGTIVVWNANLWHCAGENTTDYPRRSVTPEFTKPFIKQGFNYPQFCTEHTPEYLKQVLGYYSRTPSNWDEWYQKPENRLYRSDQG